MSGGAFDGIWEFARSLTVFSPDGLVSRQFLGFLEPLSFTAYESVAHKKPFLLPKEKFRLIAQPEEDFFGGGAERIACGGDAFEILSVKPVYIGEVITHRECVLLKTGEVENND